MVMEKYTINFLKRLLTLPTLFSWNHTLFEDEALRGGGKIAAAVGSCKGRGKRQVSPGSRGDFSDNSVTSSYLATLTPKQGRQSEAFM